MAFPTQLTSIYSHWTSRPRTYFLTAAAMTVLIVYFSNFYFQRAEAIITPQITHLANQLNNPGTNQHILKGSLLTHSDAATRWRYLHLDAVLRQKLLDANARALFHLRIAGNVAIIASAQSAMTLTATAAAAFFLFFALRRGLENSDKHVLIAFVVCAAAAAGFFAAPSVSELKENFRANANAYVSLLSVADRIHSFSATDVKGESASTDEFLKNIDRALNDSRALHFQFDISKTPSVSEMFNGFTPGKGAH